MTIPPGRYDGAAVQGATLLDGDRAAGVVRPAAADDEAGGIAALDEGAPPEADDPPPHQEQAPTTRELLAEVASREPSVPRPRDQERRERSFVRWLLAATVLVLLLVGGALWWLDPISVTGRQTRFSVVENGGVRQAKLDLMEELASPPDVLLLGSSRTMKLDPADIEELTGAEAFNAGVSGGTTQDIYLYTRYAEELWGGSDQTFPHLVIGVVNDSFRFTGTAALDPRLKRYLPSAEQERDALDVAKALLQVKTVEAAARAVNRVVRQDGPGALLRPEEGAGEVTAALATTGRQKANQRQNLDERGMQLFRPGANYSLPLADRVEQQMREYVRRGYEADAAYEGMDERGLDLLRRTIRVANANGDVPTIWITPFQPGAREHLPDEYEERDARFRAAVEELQQDQSLRFTFVDFDELDSFGGDPEEFFDGIHMTEANTRKVLAELHRRDLLVPDEG